MDDATRRAISDSCFFGRPPPASLEKLWAEESNRLAELFGITKLLVDLEPVEELYGESRASSPDELIRLRAYGVVFRELGFFAQLDGGELLAYWLRPGSDEPPIVELDTEGILGFKGFDMREALFRLARDEDCEDEARKWLADAGLDPGELPAIGVTTQFFPSLEELQSSIARASSGAPGADPQPSPIAIDEAEATTWILQPGDVVEAVIKRALGAPLQAQFVWMTGSGLVAGLALEQGLTARVSVLGISKPTTRTAIQAALGEPDKAGDKFISYVRDRVRTNFRFDREGNLDAINLALAD